MTLREYGKGFFIFLIIIAFAGVLQNSSAPVKVSAQTIAELQAQIQILLAQLAVLQAQLANQGKPLVCTNLTTNLYFGLKDAGTGGQVSKLQAFLKAQGDYTHPTITGYYGYATQAAVKKFQKRIGLVSSGASGTTGYGTVGPLTRSKIKAISCPYVPPAPTPPTPVPGPLPPPVPPPNPILPPTPPPPPGAISITCTAAPTSIGVGQSSTWTALVSGGTTPYSYSWNGTDNLSGSAQSVVKVYGSVGTKSASVTVNGVSKNCSNTVSVTQTPPPPQPINISCSANPTSINTGQSSTWTATVSGGTSPYTYSWSGTDNLSGSSPTVIKTYALDGTKTGSVTVNGTQKNCSNSVTVTTPSEPNALVWPPSGIAEKDIFAYMWQSSDGAIDLPYVGYMAWVGASGGYVDNPVGSLVNQVLAVTNNMKVGHRVMYLRNVNDWLFFYKNLQTGETPDMCKTPTGENRLITIHPCGLSIAHNKLYPSNTTSQCSSSNHETFALTNMPAQCVWWENGKQFTKDWYHQFFPQYKNLGGKLDIISLDIEGVEQFSAYGLYITQRRCENARALDPKVCPISWCEAMEQDSRWPPAGFPSELLGEGNKISTTVCSPNWAQYYLKYDNWLLDRHAQYENEAIYDVAKQYFPSVKTFDYGMYHWSSAYPVPAYGTIPLYGAGDGTHVGTHQGPFVYGNLHSEYNFAEPYPFGPNIPNYTQTPFNAFRYDVNSIRSSYLSNSTKLMPWMTNKSWGPSLLKNTDLYQEMLFHSGMTGTEHFGYWTYVINGTVVNESNYINTVLTELNHMVGYQGVTPIVSDIVPWTQEYVLTGAQVGTHKVWRFTPKNMSGSLIQSGNLSATLPVVFSAGGNTITIPNATIYVPSNPASVSNLGYWVIQAPGAGNPTIASAAGSSESGQYSMFASVWLAVKGFFATLFARLLDLLQW